MKTKILVLALVLTVFSSGVASACVPRRYRHYTPPVIVDEPYVPEEEPNCPYNDNLPIDSDECVPPVEPTPQPEPTPVAPAPVVLSAPAVVKEQPVLPTFGK